MEMLNAISKYDALTKTKNVTLLKETTKDFLLLLAPFVPHFAEEIWEQIGGKKSIFLQDFPTFDESALVKDEIEYAVQLNSKIRFRTSIASGLTADEIKAILLADPRTQEMLDGKEIKKFIVIPGRLINVIA